MRKLVARALAVLSFSLLAACGAASPSTTAPEPAGDVVVPPPPATSADSPASPRGPVAGAGAWMTDEASARALAKSGHLPLLVDFRAAWCAACVELEKRTYPDPAVAKELERFVLLRVDVTNDDDPEVKRLEQRYGIEALPSVLLFDATGHEVRRVSDFVAPAELVKLLAPIR